IIVIWLIFGCLVAPPRSESSARTTRSRFALHFVFCSSSFRAQPPFRTMPKDKVKIKYEITVKKITKLPEKLNGSTIFILWRRGSRKNQGLTKRALVLTPFVHQFHHFFIFCD